MTNTKIDIKILISVGILEGRSLEMTVRDSDQVVYQHLNTDIDDVKLQFSTTLPTDLVFEISGKDANDTRVDSDGTVLADKFLRADALCINGICVKKWALESRIFEFRGHRGERTRTNYWGNGQARLVLPKDLLEFWLDMLTVQD